MTMQRTMIVILLLFVSLSVAPARSDDLTNAAVTPTSVLPIRDSPPGNFFQGKGAQIGVANPGEQFFVLQQLAVRTIAGSEDWLKIQSASNRSLIGWIFAGPSGSPPANVRRM